MGNAVIQRALITAMLRADCPMSVGEALAAVEDILGHPASRDSVNSLLVDRLPWTGAAI